MIEHKYGEFSDEQFAGFKKRLHGWVHWCLIYAEEKNPELDHYFEKTLTKIAGLNSLFNNDENIVELILLLESARNEYREAQTKTKTYRCMILEAHELIDRMYEYRSL